jgi:hypothetical protein
MFAKPEKFGAPDRNRWHSSAVGAAPSNDNHLAAPHRKRRRPILYCHWHKGPTGTLECVWDTGAPDAAAADEPGMCWLVKQRQLSRDARSLAEPRRAAVA